MNHWINPPPRSKSDEENEFPQQDATTYIPPISFDTIKKQVKKKKPTKKSKKERIADKSISLAERLGYGTHK